MKNYCSVLALAIVLGLIPSLTINAQITPGKPDNFIDPDHDSHLFTSLDSIVRYAYTSPNDSSRLNKWEYSYNPEPGLIISSTYSWAPATKEYHLYQRYESAYNESGQQTLEAHYFYSWPTRRWRGCDSEGCGKKEWDYDVYGNQIRSSQFYWSKNSRSWLKSYETRSEYDPFGNQTLSAYYSYSYDHKRVIGNSKSEYSYDQDQRLWCEINYRWDHLDMDWRFTHKTLNEYTDLNTVIQTSFFHAEYFNFGQDHDWIVSSNRKIVNQSDVTGLIDEEIIFEWRGSLNGWTPNSRVTDKKNLRGQTILYQKYYWNQADSTWRNHIKKEREYDSNGRKTLAIDYWWSAKDSLWVGALVLIGPGKNEFQYNDQGQLTMYSHYDWDKEQLCWTGNDDNHVELIYNENHQLMDEIRYDWDENLEDWKVSNKLTFTYTESGEIESQTKLAWDEDIQDWILVIRYFFFRSASTSVKNIAQSEINIFPNPNDGILNISGLTGPANLKILSLQGRQILYQEINSDKIDLGDLSKGLYILRIQAGEIFLTKKLIKN